MDEAWLFVTKRIIFRCVSAPLAWFDRHVIDGFMNFLAWATVLRRRRYNLCRADGYRLT